MAVEGEGRGDAKLIGVTYRGSVYKAVTPVFSSCGPIYTSFLRLIFNL